MPNYIRARTPGGTYFFTVVTRFRKPILGSQNAVGLFHEACWHVLGKRPVEICSEVILPDHIHCIWRIPEDDVDFSTRWRLIKNLFTQRYLAMTANESEESLSRRKRGERGVWQRRFWEHKVRDEQEYEKLCDYFHYNPVKHGYVGCAYEWEFSTFSRFVEENKYPSHWGCSCCECNSPIEKWAIEGGRAVGED